MPHISKYYTKKFGGNAIQINGKTIRLNLKIPLSLKKKGFQLEDLMRMKNIMKES